MRTKTTQGKKHVIASKKLGQLLFPGCVTIEDVEERIKHEDDATARNLWTCARRLMEVLGCDDVIELYRRPKEVISWLEGEESPPAFASKLTYYSALSALSNPEKNRYIASKVPLAARKQYLQKAAELGKVVREEQSKNRLDDREKMSILPWPRIVSAYKSRKQLLNDSQAVIAALYLAGGDNPSGAPRRLDYNAIKIFRNSHPSNVPTDLNYIVVKSPARVDLVLQEFKTRKYYGPYNTILPKPVSRVIYDSIEANPREWLIHDSIGSPLTPSSFGRRLSGTLNRLTGRPIGASNLRKSFITWLYSRDDVSPKRLEDYAKAMHHSPAEQKMYRRKYINSTLPKNHRSRAKRGAS